MPEVRCPGYPQCKRHFKYVMGMKGHAICCPFASKHIIKRPPSHPGYRLGGKAAEYVVFGENHEIGNDKICRQGITVYTPACFYMPPYCGNVYWRPVEADAAVDPCCPKGVATACAAASTASLATACRPTLLAETACKAACTAANTDSLVGLTACRPNVVAETACSKAENTGSLVTACVPNVVACRPNVVAATACRPYGVAGTACRPTVVAETACRPNIVAETACKAANTDSLVTV